MGIVNKNLYAIHVLGKQPPMLFKKFKISNKGIFPPENIFLSNLNFNLFHQYQIAHYVSMYVLNDYNKSSKLHRPTIVNFEN
jgi:hypothetical protein